MQRPDPVITHLTKCGSNWVNVQKLRRLIHVTAISPVPSEQHEGLCGVEPVGGERRQDVRLWRRRVPADGVRGGGTGTLFSAVVSFTSVTSLT